MRRQRASMWKGYLAIAGLTAIAGVALEVGACNRSPERVNAHGGVVSDPLQVGATAGSTTSGTATSGGITASAGGITTSAGGTTTTMSGSTGTTLPQ